LKWTAGGRWRVQCARLLLNVMRLQKSSKLGNAVLPMWAQKQTLGGRGETDANDSSETLVTQSCRVLSPAYVLRYPTILPVLSVGGGNEAAFQNGRQSATP
jgi:hypothetical protein